jgi:hypothetical protein
MIGKVVGAISFLIIGWFLGMFTRGLMAEDTEVRLAMVTASLEQEHRKISAAQAEAAAAIATAKAEREAREQEVLACQIASVSALKEAREAHAAALAAKEEVLQARISTLSKALAAAKLCPKPPPKKREPEPYPYPYREMSPDAVRGEE